MVNLYVSFIRWRSHSFNAFVTSDRQLEYIYKYSSANINGAFNVRWDLLLLSSLFSWGKRKKSVELCVDFLEEGGKIKKHKKFEWTKATRYKTNMPRSLVYTFRLLAYKQCWQLVSKCLKKESPFSKINRWSLMNKL